MSTPFFSNFPDKTTLDVIFEWSDESDEHVWEWTLFCDPSTGIYYETASIYCPCCGGPKGSLMPIWNATSWEKPYWVTPEQEALFRNKVMGVLS